VDRSGWSPAAKKSLCVNGETAISIIFGRPFVKRFTLCYQTGVCLSVLPVMLMLMYCGQTIGWIKMKFGMQVGLGTGHILVDGDPAPLPPKGQSPRPILAYIGCGQMAGWINMPVRTEVGLDPSNIVLDGNPAHPNFRPMSRPHCAKLHSPKKDHSPPIFGPCLMWPNGCMDQDATWHDGRSGPRPHCAKLHYPKKDHSLNFPPIFIVAKQLDGPRCHLVWR